MNIQALDERVLIKQNPPEKTSFGGFKIPESSVFRPNKGVVISVGKNVKEIKEGDTVLFDGSFGLVMEKDGDLFRVLEKRNIFAVENK